MKAVSDWVQHPEQFEFFMHIWDPCPCSPGSPLNWRFTPTSLCWLVQLGHCPPAEGIGFPVMWYSAQLPWTISVYYVGIIWSYGKGHCPNVSARWGEQRCPFAGSEARNVLKKSVFLLFLMVWLWGTKKPLSPFELHSIFFPTHHQSIHPSIPPPSLYSEAASQEWEGGAKVGRIKKRM